MHPEVSKALVLAGIIFGGLIACIALHGYYSGAERQLRFDHERELRTLRAQASERATEAANRRRREIQQAFGGAVQEVAKNPKLPLTEMIRSVARLCAPRGTEVEVRVDRFTEFDVDFQLTRKISDDEMARVTKAFLGECSAYVNSIRFIHAGQVIAEADRRKIDSIPDWKSVPLDQLR
jgi:hypothetical protein